MRALTNEDVNFAVKGGSVFASGGGGWVDHGMSIGHAAITLGQPKLAHIDELNDEDIVITTSAIGAPAGTTDWQMLGKDYIKAVSLLQEAFAGKITGVMTPQNGMSSSINGWLPAAALDLVVVDAVGDMRAHPTGKMGSLGLADNLTYETIQVAVGGKNETGSYIELIVKGTTSKTANILRTASDMSGGFIACARHPLPASYIKEHAAIGGISRIIELGQVMTLNKDKQPEDLINEICKTTSGDILSKGIVTQKNVHYTGAYDIGTIHVESENGNFILHVMNEYMAVDSIGNKRVATYPDVITSFSLKTGLPISVGDIEVDEEIAIFKISQHHIPLSSSVKDKSVYPEVEKALNIKLYNI